MNPIEKGYSELKAFLRHGPPRHFADVSAGGCLEPIGQHFRKSQRRQVDQRFVARMIALFPALGLDAKASKVGQDLRQVGVERGQVSSIMSDACPPSDRRSRDGARAPGSSSGSARKSDWRR